MDEFVNSKAMITPGIAGSATTMITGTLVSQFGFPGSYTALAISFMLGLLVFTDRTVIWMFKIVFYLIYSMTIFSAAVGINEAGMAIIEKDRPDKVIARTLPPQEKDSSKEESEDFFQDWF